MDARDADPLLGAHRHQDDDEGSIEQRVQSHRAKGQQILSSRKKHFIVMSLVALDVVALLANVFIQLIACEMHQDDEHWVQVVVSCLEAIGLTISSLFMVELVACMYSYGMSYFSSWFIIFDSAIIVLSFVIDIASTGLTQSIGSLLIILRFWRLAKISEELVLGATVRMDLLEQQLHELEHENGRLKAQLNVEPHTE
ncbi:hydrogen voltage-gated channel 1 [Sarocladium strictum]